MQKSARTIYGFNCLVALGAMLLACVLVKHVAPLPEVRTVSSKLRFFAAHKNEYNTLFIGSSRFYRQISPRIFDPELKNAGLEIKSLNLGVDGMMLPESWYFFDQVMREKPAHLKWIFIELTDLDFKIPKSDQGTVNSVYWHDWKRMKVVCCEFWKRAKSDFQRTKKVKEPTFDLLALHTPLYFRNFTNLGRGFEFIHLFFNREPPKRDGTMGIGHDGYIAPPHRWSMNRDVKPGYRAALKKLGEPQHEHDSQALRKMVQEMEQTVQAHQGVTLLFLVPPTMKPIRESWIKEESSPTPILFLFNDPAKFPQFYDENRRLDMEHINRDAGVEFTKLLAARFAEYLETGN